MNSDPKNGTLKTPILVKVGEPNVDFHSGVCIIDVGFPNAVSVEIGEIQFRNYYAHTLTMKARKKGDATGAEPKWKTCIKKMKLMPHPHFETGAQSYFTISKKQLLYDLTNIIGLRIILRQPSPVWKDFKIEECKFLKVSTEDPIKTVLPTWLIKHGKGSSEHPSNKQIKNAPPVEEISQHLQTLWSLSEEVKKFPNVKKTSRFDIDGSYDINLLSYT